MNFGLNSLLISVANIWIHEYHQEFVLPCKLYAENLPEDIGKEEESN